MSLKDYYQQYLKETGSEVAAAIFALDSFHRDESKEPANRDKLNPKDIAKQLAVSPAKVIGWIRSGQLKASNIATGTRPRYIIEQSSLETFLKNRQQQKPPTVQRSKRRLGEDGNESKRY